METKKNPVHNLEKSFSLRLFAGLAIALSMTLVAFEWRTPFEETNFTFNDSEGPEIIYEYIPVTEETKEEKQEQPKELERKTFKAEVINLVDNTEKETKKEEALVKEVKKNEVTVFIEPEKLPEEKAEEEIFRIVEEMPEYEGGEKALLNYLMKNTKYPEIPKQNGVSGVVYVSFVVDRTGEVTNVKVERSVDPYLDKEAIRVVSSLKNYKPGKQRGKPVAVAFTLPIRFELH